MTRKLLYKGISMNPLFREGDMLEVVPYHGREIELGDVVAFSPPEKPGKVIHRVVAVKPGGLVTKGDNCVAVDDWILTPGDILGKVVAIHRQGRVLPVPEQAPASLYLLKGRQWCDRAVSRLLQPLYHRLARSGLFTGRLGEWMKPKVFYFSRAEGPEWQLWWGNLLIGRKLPHQTHWSIRRPFRLLVDETTLPHQLPESSRSIEQ
jgi:Signal peptidase, peptidase S26